MIKIIPMIGTYVIEYSIIESVLFCCFYFSTKERFRYRNEFATFFFIYKIT